MCLTYLCLLRTSIYFKNELTRLNKIFYSAHHGCDVHTTEESFLRAILTVPGWTVSNVLKLALPWPHLAYSSEFSD